MILDKAIFTLEEVRTIKNVSVNIDDFAQYARQAQTRYLQKLLGDKLYKAMLDDLDGSNVPQTPRFVALLDGEVYVDGRSIIFRGIKEYCIYVWLHLYMAEGALNITPLGANLFKDEHAEYNESKKAFRNAEANYIGAANGLEDPTLRYLRKNADTYPEFEESLQIEQAENDDLTFRVVGRSFDTPDNFLV